MIFATDYEQATEPGRLMKETGPEFLTRLGALEAPPPDDRYKPGILNEAAAELDDAVEWSPRLAGNTSSGGNASGTTNASSSANATGGS